MNIYMICSLIAVVSLYFMAFFVYQKGKNNAPNRYFAIITFLGGTWCWWPFLLGISPNDGAALIVARGIYIAALLCPPAFLRFTLTITENEFTFNKRAYLIVSWILTFLLLLVLPTDLFFYGVKRFLPYFTVKAGPFYNLFIIYFSAIYLYCWKEVIVAHSKTSDAQKKNQLRYVLIAFVVASVAGFMHLFSPYLNTELFPHDILMITYSSLFAYAIVRHQLMDIEVIIRRAAVFAGLFAFVYAVFAGMAYLTQVIFQNIIGLNRWIAMIPSVLIVIFTLRPLEQFLIKVTDKFLFQKKYDYRDLLKTFSTEVLTVFDLPKLENLTVDSLSKIIRLESCTVLIYDKEKDNYPISASLGLKESNQIFDKNTHLVNYLLRTHHYLLKDKTIANLPDEGTIKEELKKLNAELVIPIVLHDDLMGALALGRKKSGEEFTQDDLAILIPLSQTLAVAISNAQLFLELSKTQQEAAQKEKMAVIGTLASGINHEICNPLGIARGQCEAFLLNKRDGIYHDKPDTEQLTEAMRVMELVIKETDRATSITKKLSSFAKPSKGELADDVDISKELDEVISLVGYELKLDKIELVKNIPPSLPHIRADKKQLQEIFFNLIRNAAQAITESGKITVSAYETAERDGSAHQTGTPFTIQSSSQGKSVPNLIDRTVPSSNSKKVIIDISDTGCGIPEDKLGMIFNPFYTTKEPGKGTGLGLFIVRQVVERNRGRISLKSKAGEGTTFTLEFPVVT